MRRTTKVVALFTTSGVVAWLLAPGPAWGQGPYEWPWGMHWMWGMWGIGMAIGMLVFWGLIIAGLVFAVRWLASQGRPHSPGALSPGTRSSGEESPLDIVKRRYARGEITREEFETLKRDLTQS